MWFVYESESQNDAFWEGSAEYLFPTNFPVVCFEWTEQGSATYFCPYVLIGLEHGSSVSCVADTAEHERTHTTFS